MEFQIKRGMSMPDDVPRHLESLTVGKLKIVAARYGIDVNSCKHKKDFVARLSAANVTESQIQEALALKDCTETPNAGRAEEIATARHDIEIIAEKTSGARVLPFEDEAEVEKNIDRALLVRPSFFEIDSQVESAWNHMIMADYHDALKVNNDARSRMLDRFSSFQIFSCALSIRAAESIMASLQEAEGTVDPSLKTILAEAKRSFIDGSPKHREETLEELEKLTSRAYEAFFEGSTKAEAELRAMLADYESFGTQTQESRRLLEIAEQARQSFNVAEYARLLEEAHRAGATAKDVRKTEIEKSFGIVRSAVHEAREVGAVLSVGEDDLAHARTAFDEQAFKRATDLLAAIERTADQAHFERIKDKDVRDRHVKRVTETIAGLEKTLQEAASYGMDVEEGLLFVTRARGALGNKDIINAAKLARHTKDQTNTLETDLDKERVNRGIAKKVDDAKCGKCGKEALYSFPNGMRKCVECGHSFSMTVAPVSTTMEPIEKPVSSSQPQKSETEDTSALSEGQPKKRVLTRSLKKL